MFQFPGFPPRILFDSYAGDYITIAGFPHSDICGSMFICNSPQLFAACHVLLRRLVPRHPPYALSSLILFLSLCGLFFLKTFQILSSNVIYKKTFTMLFLV